MRENLIFSFLTMWRANYVHFCNVKSLSIKIRRENMTMILMLLYTVISHWHIFKYQMNCGSEIKSVWQDLGENWIWWIQYKQSKLLISVLELIVVNHKMLLMANNLLLDNWDSQWRWQCSTSSVYHQPRTSGNLVKLGLVTGPLATGVLLIEEDLEIVLMKTNSTGFGSS